MPLPRCLLLALLALAAPVHAAPPVTVAEKSDYKATSKHAEVVAFCEALAKESPLVRLAELGKTHEGRSIPLVVLADPPVATAAEAAKSGKLVVFAMGNIHAGEVDGKEALLALVRDLALAKDRPLLKDLVLVFCPNFNGDGNEPMSAKNRGHQAGPAEVGTRANAQGFDLNRDFVKLESPEVRALVRFIDKWDPAIVVDCHTTNGSFHRYTITYEGGRCPAGDGKVIEFTRDQLLPTVTERMRKATGYLSTFYGNFSPDRSEWQTVPPQPRYGTHYVGLRNRIGVLSESYVYASYKDRVLSTYAFVKTIAGYAAENKTKIAELLKAARDARPEKVALRFDSAPHGRPREFLGFVEETKDGKRVSTGKPKSYEVTYMGGATPTLTVARPFAYLVPASFGKAVENLQRHGVAVEELREDIDLDVESYRVTKIAKARDFQKHQAVTLDVAAARKEKKRVAAGTFVVKTATPLGHLACFLLEPQSADGLVTWNFFDAGLKEGNDFPVLRLPASVPMTTGRARPLPEDRVMNRPVPTDAGEGQAALSFAGNPAVVQRWLDDDHFVQAKGGRTLKVHAATGRSEPLPDDAAFDKAFATIPGFAPPRAGGKGGPPSRGGQARRVQYDAKRASALVEHQGHLYHAPAGGKATRLTKATGERELVSLSPDGGRVAFVRGNNLHVIDVKTQAERALTADGGENVRSGKASWVYFEELFNRNGRAYWWSPDGTRIAFLRSDESPVPRFRLTDGIAADQTSEATAYPKAGKPNPLVKLGVANTADGSVRWVELKTYPEKDTLVVRAGFAPDGRLFYYVQDRAQTWLDVCVRPRDGESKRLFRETTRAWVEDHGAPTFLKDGGFLFTSERTGWKHVYRYAADGTLVRPLTSGEWEARKIEAVDEDGGWLYFSGTRDSHLGSNLYRVKLDGTGSVDRLTKEPGDHAVSLSPKAKYFVTTFSDHKTPTQLRLYRADGTPERVLDTNPVYVREEYRTGRYEMVKIPTPDGFTLEGSVLYPPGFDGKKRYPVWFMTYAGPHAPTVRDAWAGGRVRDEILAATGYVVFRCDPRSASGKGAVSTWSAYKQLGVQELKDIECAVKWLAAKPGIDATRVGMSGGSYGGFMTAFAMTHSKVFAAGIASASVTDWHNYDSIYTERYMLTPKDNPKGYEATSVVKAAKDLHGKLLLVHGLMDDNVHAQNTIALVDALQRAGREFEVMFYPRSRHGIASPHYRKLSQEFMRKALRPGE